VKPLRNRVRLGIIYPGGAQAEEEYYEFAEEHGNLSIFLVISRIPEGGGHDINALLETARIEHLTEAAQRLVKLKPDAVLWACTSGSFVVGRTGAEQQIRAIEEMVHAPASSTSLAFVQALEHLKIKQVAIAATYPSEASEAFKNFLAEFGIVSLKVRFSGAPSGYDASKIPPNKIMELARSADVPTAEAILLPDTALHSLGFIQPLEELLRKPVLTANQVTLWQGLRLAGETPEQRGLGKLMAQNTKTVLSIIRERFCKVYGWRGKIGIIHSARGGLNQEF
jgi:maleate cis-trans isomerase